MKKISEAVWAVLLVASALAVLMAGPLTANAAVTLVGRVL